MPKKILIGKLISRSLFIIAWFVFWILCYFYYVDSDVLLTPNSNNPIFVIVLIVVMVFPFGITKIFQIIFSRTGDGVVINKRLKYLTDMRNNGKGINRGYNEVVDVHVKRDDGKIVVRRFDTKISINADYYIIGNRVRIHKGVKYFEKLDKSKDKKIICLECGHISVMEKVKCYNCGRKLYKGEGGNNAEKNINR